MKPHHIHKIKSVSEFLVSESIQLDTKSKSCVGTANDTLLHLVAVPRLASENASSRY